MKDVGNWPHRVKIVEVGPRDGLQNESKVLSTEDKLLFIQGLIDAGLKTIEATSFVRPEKIPQLSDAEALFSGLIKSQGHSSLNFPCLVPNLKGLGRAVAVGVKEIALFTATSETFNLRNIDATIEGSLESIRGVALEAKKNNLKMRGYISTVFGCPYEGETDLQVLKMLCQELFQLGIYEVSLGDTIGVGTPKKVKEVLTFLSKDFPLNKFSLHFHDTYGLALSNVLASLDFGMEVFDSSAAGLGGCPYAQGASGNVATEDLVYFFSRQGIETGVSLDKLMKVSQRVLSKLGKVSPSKVLLSSLKKESP